MPVHRVMVPLNITHSRLVRCIESKCGIDPLVSVTRVAYMESGGGGVYILWSDQDVTEFLQFAAELNDAPTLYVYDDSPMCSGANVAGTSNTGGDVIAVDQTPYMPQFDNVEILSNYTYGVGDYNTSYVPETEQPQEEEEVEDHEDVAVEEEEEEVEDTDFDNYVFDIPSHDDEETRREAYFVRSLPGNDDYHDMPPPPPHMTEEPVITPNQPIPYNRRGRVKEEQIFRSKPELTLALGLKFLEEGFEFKTLRSGNHRYEAVCVHANCGWRIYATSIAKSQMFEVRKLNDVHTCSRTQMHPAHRQATRRVLGHLLLDKTGDISRNIRGCDIVRDIKARYKIDISYWQAWRAKWHAICMIEGNPEESFTRLPQYFYNLELNNPGTVTDITTDVSGRFASCFYALGVSIHTFRSQLLRKVLIIDGAHLKGDYLGTMFLAVAMDANNQVVPIAIGVAKSESGESCTYFFEMLRRCIGEMEGLVFMTDRSKALRQAINTVYPTAHHAYCCRHLYMNIKAKDGSVEYNKSIFWKTCKAYTAYEFDLNMSALRAAVPGSVLLDKVGPHRWSRAHFPGVRYNIMSSNSVESMNAHSRFARRRPIVGLLDYFRAYQQEWYSKRRDFAALLTNTLTPWAEAKVQRRAVKSAAWTAHDIGYGEFEVQDGYRDARVHYLNQTCSCNKWQLSGLPCGHAIAVAAKLNCTECSHLASVYFTTNNLKATYAPVIYPVGPVQTWLNPGVPLMTVRPPIINKGPGRPSKHNRIPSRGEGINSQRCSRCQQYGHTRNLCTSVAPSQRPSGSRQAEAAPTQQMDQSYRHYTFDLNDDLNIDLND